MIATFPLQMISDEIDGAIKAELFYVALVTALMVPDVCCALGSEDGRSRHGAYATWYDKYLKNAYSHLSGEDCYRLRCGVSHEARLSKAPSRSQMAFDRIVFTLPNQNLRVQTTVRNVTSISVGGPPRQDGGATPMEKSYNTDLVLFCCSIIEAAKTWYAENAASDMVQANLANLVQYRSRGPVGIENVERIIA